MNLREDIHRIRQIMGIISEGKRIKIDGKVMSDINQIIDSNIPNAINNFKYSYTNMGIEGPSNTFVGSIKYNELGDDKILESKVYIIFNESSHFAGQYDPDNKSIILNLIWITEYGVNPKDLQGNYDRAKEYYRDVMIHEMIHAMDPKVNRLKNDTVFKNYKAGGGSTDEENIRAYLTHDIEVIANTNTLLNRIIKQAEIIKLKEDDKKLYDMFIKNMDLLLKAFSTGNFSLINNYEFLSIMEGAMPKKFVSFLEKVSTKIENIFSTKNTTTETIVKEVNKDPFLHEILFTGKRNTIHKDITIILLYKEYNPKAWREFLTKLYHTVQEAKEIINKTYVAD